MPYVRIRTNKEISKEKEIAIKERLGRAITLSIYLYDNDIL